MIHRLEALAGRDVPRETFERLQEYAGLVRDENRQQNLVSPGSLDNFWERHILDAAQLVRFEPAPGARWVDVGSGAGLPGVVVACLVQGPVTLVEPRRLRADFLHRVCESLGLRATVAACKVERVEGTYDVITARAVTRVGRLLEISAHLSTRNTVWALPKGQGAEAELVEARRSWQGTFHVEHSLTDADSLIVIGRGVRAKP